MPRLYSVDLLRAALVNATEKNQSMTEVGWTAIVFAAECDISLNPDNCPDRGRFLSICGRLYDEVLSNQRGVIEIEAERQKLTDQGSDTNADRKQRKQERKDEN